MKRWLVLLLMAGIGAALCSSFRNFFGVASGSIRAVASVDALRSIAAAEENTVVMVLGYRSPADGGGGMFTYLPKATMTEDGGMVIVPRSGKGRWKRVADSGTFNVRWFGAHGDGRTDDHVALQMTFGAARAAGGGAVYLPRGTYLIKDHVYADFSDVRICGDGIGITTIKVGAWVDGIRVSTSNYPLSAEVITNVVIENLSIDGNRNGYARGPNDTFGNGINLNSVQNFFVRNVRVYDTAEQGIVSTFFGPTGAERQSQASICDTIVDMSADYGKIAIGFEGHHSRCIAVGNRVRAAAGGIGIYFGNSGDSAGITGENVCVGNVLTGEVTGIGIRADRHWHALSVTGNVIQGFAIGIRTDNDGEMDSSGCSIAANQILDFAEYGIVTSPAAGGDMKATISANSLSSARDVKAGALLGSGTVFASNTVSVSRADAGVVTNGKCLVSLNLVHSGGASVQEMARPAEDAKPDGDGPRLETPGDAVESRGGRGSPGHSLAR